MNGPTRLKGAQAEVGENVPQETEGGGVEVMELLGLPVGVDKG